MIWGAPLFPEYLQVGVSGCGYRGLAGTPLTSMGRSPPQSALRSAWRPSPLALLSLALTTRFVPLHLVSPASPSSTLGGPPVLARLAQWFFSAAFRLRVGAGFSLAGPAWARGGRCLIRKGEDLGQAPVRWVGVRWGVGVWKRPS